MVSTQINNKNHRPIASTNYSNIAQNICTWHRHNTVSIHSIEGLPHLNDLHNLATQPPAVFFGVCSSKLETKNESIEQESVTFDIALSVCPLWSRADEFVVDFLPDFIR